MTTGRPFPWTVWVILANVGCLFSTHRTSVCVCQDTHDVRGCPSAHTGRTWLSVFVCHRTHDVHGCPSVHISARWSLDSARWPIPWTVRVILAHVGCLFSTHRTSVGVRQHTQDVRVCPSAHTGRLCMSVSTHMTSVAVRVWPSAHTGRPWLSICTHISTLVLGLSTLTLLGDCSGDFGPRGLSVPYTQDIRGCPPAHKGHLWLSDCVRLCLTVSVSTHKTFYTQDVRGCPPAHIGRLWLSISTHFSTLVLGLSTLALHVDCSGDFGPRELSVQYTQDVSHTGRMWLSVCVRVCPPTHTGRPWLSISTHISTLVLGLSMLALPVDCLGDFGPLGLSVQYTHDVRGCPPAHTRRPWLSVITHRTTHKTSVAVRVCPSAHTGRPWLSISTHISTLVLGLSTLAFPVDCLGDFGPRGLFVQYTQDVRWCPPAHTGRSWLSVPVRQYMQDVCGCLCVCPCVSVSTHTGHLWLSISTHISTLILGLSMLALPMDCSGDFGPRGLSVQYTKDIRGCLSAHTGRPCVSVTTLRTSVAVHVCPCVSVSTHRTSVAVYQYTYQHVGPWTQHADPSHGLFGTSVAVCVCPCVSVCVRQHTKAVRGCPSVHISACCTHRTSVGVYQHTQDVRGCPSAHTERLWLSVCVRHHTQDVQGCPSVHISARWSLDSARCRHRTSVGVRQHTQDVCVCPSAHTGRPCVSIRTHRTSVFVRVCPSAHIGRPWQSICTHISTLVLGLSMLTLPVDCSRDFGPRGLSVLYTEDVCGILVLGLSTLAVPVDCSGDFGPRGRSVQYTQDVCVSVSTHRTSAAVLQHTHDVRGCPCVSVCVRQHTQDVRGCPSVHISARWTSVPVRHHTQDVRGCTCVSVSTHRTSVAVNQYTYQHVGPWTQHADPSRGLFGCLWPTRVVCSIHTGRPWVNASTHRTSVAVCVCPSAHTGRLWLSVCVRVCLCVSVSTQRPSVAVHQYTYQHAVHTGHPWVSACTHMTSVAVRQHTLNVCGCPCVSITTHKTSKAVHQYTYQHADTGRPWVSVSTHRTSVCVRQHTQDVRVCPSPHTGRPRLSISTHISTLVLGLSTVALPVDCSGDFGPRGRSVQYTQDVCVSVSTHRTSTAVLQHTQDVRGCPCVSVSTHRTSMAVRVCPSAHTGRTWLSVCVHQHSQDVRGCPSVHISARCRHRTSVGVRQHTQDVRVCPSAHTGRPCVSVTTYRTSKAVHQYTYQHADPWTQHAGPSHGLFGTSVCVRHHTQDVRGCTCVSVSTHRTSVAVNQYTYQHVGPWTQHADPSRGLFGCLWPTRVVCSIHTGRPWVNASTHRTSVAVCVCPSAHTGRLWLSVCVRVCLCVSVSTQRPSVAVHQYTYQHAVHTGHPWVSACTHMTSVAVRQHTLNVCGCPCVSITTHKTSKAVHQYTYQHADTGRPWVSVSTHRTSVCVRQHTQDVRVCPSPHTGRPRLSISTHISTLVLGLSTVALPVDCSGDFGPRGRSVQYTQDVCVSVSTHRTSTAVLQHTQDVRGCPCVSVSTHRTYVAVRVCPSALTGRPWLSISTHISTLVLGLSTLTLPVDCLGYFGPRGLSIQYTQDIRGCPPAHTGRPWLSVCVRLCPTVSVSTHRTSVAVHQYTYQHVGPWTQHAGPSRGLFGTFVAVRVCPCVSVCVHQHTQDFHGCPSYTQDVRGCPPAHTGRPWLSVCVRLCPTVSVSTHRTSMAVHQYIYQHIGPWTQHAGPSRGLFGLFSPTWAVCSVHTRRPWVSASTHRTSVAVRQHTQNVCGCPCVSVTTHRTSKAVHQYTYQHADIGRPWVSISTHRTSMCVRQHTQDVRVCPSEPTGRLWLSVCVRQHTHDVRGSPSLHISARWLSVQYTEDVCGIHISTLILGLSTLALPVDCSGFGPRGWSVQYTQDVCLSVSTHRASAAVLQHTQDVCGCPCVSVSTHRTSVAVHQYTQDFRGCLFNTQRTSVGVRQHTQDVCGCPCVSVCVRLCPSAHTRLPWMSIGTHISTLVHGLSTLALPVDCLGDFGPQGLSIQYTQDVRGCPPAHTGRLWLSVCVHVCLCVSVSTQRPSVAVHQYTYQHAVHTGHPWVSACTHMTSVAVRQHTLNVCGCPCVSITTHKTSKAVHQYTYQHADTGRPWVSVSTHRTSVCVRQHTQDVRVCPSPHTGRPRLSISTHISTLVLGLSTVALPVDCSGDFGPRGRSVQYTQDVCVSVSTHRTSTAVLQHTQDVRGCPCVSVSTHRTSMAVRVCPSAHTGRTWLSVCVHQHSQDVRGCPSVHISARWSLDSAR
ncbi:hypothetical protein YC2023_066303 [Brassica napus]